MAPNIFTFNIGSDSQNCMCIIEFRIHFLFSSDATENYYFDGTTEMVSTNTKSVRSFDRAIETMDKRSFVNLKIFLERTNERTNRFSAFFIVRLCSIEISICIWGAGICRSTTRLTVQRRESISFAIFFILTMVPRQAMW